jgi:class 3 adenylate cyclase
MAVLFADICGSTALYEKLGDDAAQALVTRCLATITRSLSAYRGKLVKTIGDEVLVIFPDAEAAFLAAGAIHTAVNNDQPADGPPLLIRIGFNYGEVIQEDSDIFGNTVNVAARVTAITRAGQTLATREVLDALPAHLQGNLKLIMRAEFKGKQDHQEVYQVVSEQNDVQATRCGIPAYRKSPDSSGDEMLLRHGKAALKICKGRSSVSLGRAEMCDMVVHSEFASRLHTRIEQRFGKFFIADQSANGTYIRFSDGSIVHLARQEIRLKGNGSISMGQSFTDNPDELIEFSISTTPV